LDLAEAFAEAGGVRAVVAGTCAEYDWSEGVCSEETTRLNPVSIYGASKMSLQLCLRGLWKSSGPDLCWGRIFFPYGPGEDDRKLVASVCRSLMSGAMAECSAGNQQRDFIHAGDVASALVSLLATDVEGPVNIGSGAAVSVRNLVGAVAERMGAPGRVRFGSVKRDDESAPLVVADISRLLATGWTPEFTLESGITDTVKWWLANEELAHAG
jgi:nucleoside-diphosphate-sugar epimerase